MGATNFFPVSTPTLLLLLLYCLVVVYIICLILLSCCSATFLLLFFLLLFFFFVVEVVLVSIIRNILSPSTREELSLISVFTLPQTEMLEVCPMSFHLLFRWHNTLHQNLHPCELPIQRFFQEDFQWWFFLLNFLTLCHQQ